jgi:hypothetical protein
MPKPHSWGKFRLDYLFRKIETKKVKENKQGDLPATKSGWSNNQLVTLVSSDSATILKNVISVTANGRSKAFYQSRDFTILQDSYALRLKSKVWKAPSPEINLFLISALNKLIIGNYGFSYKSGWERIKGQNISLPTTKTDEIDFEFMAQYVRELSLARVRELEAYLIATGLSSYELTQADRELLSQIRGGGTRFSKFRISDLFVSQNGNTDIQKKHINDRGEFVITAGEKDTGVLGKSDIQARTINAGTITVDMFGHAYFRDYKYKMVTHARVFALLLPDNKKLSKECGLYLVSQMHFFTQLYSYSSMASWEKIKDKTITLPTTSTNQPDYDYMEKYICIMQKLVIKDVIEWKDRIIEEMERVVG